MPKNDIQMYFWTDKQSKTQRYSRKAANSNVRSWNHQMFGIFAWKIDY